MNLGFLKSFGDLLVKNSPTILSALAVGGVVSTAIFAGQATLEAKELLEGSVGEEQVEELDLWEKTKLTWKLYIPTLASAALTVTCIVGSNHIMRGRNMALAAAYSLAERGLREFKASTHKQVGEKTMRKIHEDVAQKKVDDNPVKESTVVITGRGETLCQDALTGRYFKSSVEAIRKAENNLNHRLINGTWISVNDLYTEIGLDQVKMGDDLGWVPDNLIEFRLDTALAEGTTPCIVMDYVVDPRVDPYRSI